MIDLHCHILPGVDDGAATLEDSLAMARAALQDGVRSVVATPHGAEWAYTGGEGETRDRVAALRAEFASRGLGLELFAGLEVFITPDSPALYSQGRIYTLNGGRYLLTEFPLNMLPPYAEQALFELQLRGLVPIIAHPERNGAIAADPEILARLVGRGMLAQVTAGSLLGSFGSRTREVAELLVTCRLVHVIASDGHSATVRSPALSAAARRAAELIGEKDAQDMVTAVPAAVLHDQEIELPEALPVQRRSWFPFLRRRPQ